MVKDGILVLMRNFHYEKSSEESEYWYEYEYNSNKELHKVIQYEPI